MREKGQGPKVGHELGGSWQVMEEGDPGQSERRGYSKMCTGPGSIFEEREKKIKLEDYIWNVR